MIEKKLSIDDINLSGQKVLTRLDLNVPLKDGVITDSERIERSIPTIKKIINENGIAILCSHLGRPKGERKPELSLAPVATALSEYLGKDVKFLNDCIGQEVEDAVRSAKPGDVILLENLRYHKGETKNDPNFAQKLASLADIFVNDAFGTAHRAHASNVGVSEIVEKAVAGYLLKSELSVFSNILKEPKRPFISIIGGLKVSSKASVIDNLLPKVDRLLIGGGVIYTFYKSQDIEVGKSFVESDFLPNAKSLMDEHYGKEESKIVLPSDVKCTDDFGNPQTITEYPYNEIPSELEGIDIGTKTAEYYATLIKDAGTVVMTGPLGAFENKRYAEGTKIVLNAMMDLTKKGGITVVGGGDTVASVKQLADPKQFTHISTGGSASLEVMEGKVLPALVALTDK